MKTPGKCRASSGWTENTSKVLLKKRKTRALSECVPKNTQAIYFYQREGFKIRHEGFDEAAVEKDYVMVWRQK